jgi:hypothetical protein
MRSKKPSAIFQPSLLLRLGGHAAMGFAMGLAFALALTLIDAFGVTALVASSADPSTATVILVGTCALTFSVGATLTGFILLMMEDS